MAAGWQLPRAPAEGRTLGLKEAFATIPLFCDGYHLPPGEHPASIDEVKQRFANGLLARVRAWWYFEAFLRLLDSLNLHPHTVLINGSFVTGRPEPGDVDAAFLFLRGAVRQALALASPVDTYVIYYLLDPVNTECIRDSLGLHALACRDANELGAWSRFFRRGSAAAGLPDPDPLRDPSWVRKPSGAE